MAHSGQAFARLYEWKSEQNTCSLYPRGVFRATWETRPHCSENTTRVEGRLNQKLKIEFNNVKKCDYGKDCVLYDGTAGRLNLALYY